MLMNKEMVNHPSHYQSNNGWEVMDFIEAYRLNFQLGNAVKYILRCNSKNNKEEDLQKAIWYLKHEISLEKMYGTWNGVLPICPQMLDKNWHEILKPVVGNFDISDTLKRAVLYILERPLKSVLKPDDLKIGIGYITAELNNTVDNKPIKVQVRRKK